MAFNCNPRDSRITSVAVSFLSDCPESPSSVIFTTEWHSLSTSMSLFLFILFHSIHLDSKWPWRYIRVSISRSVHFWLELQKEKELMDSRVKVPMKSVLPFIGKWQKRGFKREQIERNVSPSVFQWEGKSICRRQKTLRITSMGRQSTIPYEEGKMKWWLTLLVLFESLIYWRWHVLSSLSPSHLTPRETHAESNLSRGSNLFQLQLSFDAWVDASRRVRLHKRDRKHSLLHLPFLWIWKEEKVHLLSNMNQIPHEIDGKDRRLFWWPLMHTLYYIILYSIW